jgi:hypothetical protein
MVIRLNFNINKFLDLKLLFKWNLMDELLNLILIYYLKALKPRKDTICKIHILPLIMLILSNNLNLILTNYQVLFYSIMVYLVTIVYLVLPLILILN